AVAGDVINGRPLANSSFLHRDDKAHVYNSHTAKEIMDAGYDGVYGEIQGFSHSRETAIFDPRNIKSAERITRDVYGNIILPSQRFNPTRNNINFSPELEESRSYSA